jgi:uncharacterized protein YggE
MCEKMGMCKGGKCHKVMMIVVAIIVILFIARLIGGGHGDWRDNKIINTITVSGTGEKMVKPDIALVSFGVSAENLDVSKAQTESATKINNIIAFLKTKNVEEKDIKTTNYSIYPRYNYVGVTTYYPYTGKQVLAAYVVSQNIEVKIRTIADAGAILTGLGEFGVTDVSGLTFTVDNQDTVKAQARELAIVDAKAQAKVLANGLGVKLVKITSFSENGNYPMYYAMEKSAVMGMGGSDAVAPQVPAGENKITSTVSITYEIK